MNREKLHPPKLPLRFFRWYCHPKRQDYIEGDLMEVYERRLKESGKRKADIKFILDVLLLFRPGIIRPVNKYENLNTYGMYKSCFKVGMRNIARHKVFSFINIVGLSVGMGVAMLIGFWIWDELSYNTYHKNYDRIASVMQHLTYNEQIGTQNGLPFPVGLELRNAYGDDFKYVVQSTGASGHVLAFQDKQFTKIGGYMDADGPEMLTLKMLSGNRQGLKDPASILISESVAKTYFGDADPMGQVIQIDDKLEVTVTGVYEDIPHNSAFKDMTFIAPWELYVASEKLEGLAKYWDWNGWYTFVQLAEHADIHEVSAKIEGLNPDKQNAYKPAFFLNPMSQWHLYSEFDNGKRAGGGIEFVRLFGTVGVFVLLLACINFMNLSTARSEKRAKETGIRKSIGSSRSQLIGQFFSESLLVVVLAFILALCLVRLSLPFFNAVADKQMTILWSNPFFWLLGIGFCLLTGIIAGSYPAFYLSSFQPVKVLKGAFKVGRFATMPRKVLVVLQFTVSITLIIGVAVVFRQVEFAKNRSVGYERDGLVMMRTINKEIQRHAEAVRSELKASGTIVEMAQASGPVTDVWSTSGDIVWKEKDPQLAADFPNTRVSHEYGKTVGWEFIAGRDFSTEFVTDSAAFVITKSAAEFMSLKDPVGEVLVWGGKPFHIIGVIHDIVQSPYGSPRPSVFHIGDASNFVVMKMNPDVPVREALSKIESTFRKYNPTAPFDYQFVDQEFDKKFGHEERIGKLTAFFTVLAIFISCLGIFGLASFVAEQRTKEIGIRKVLGASVFGLWQMLSRDFVILTVVSCLIAVPVAYYFMNNWLLHYEYRTILSWHIFAIACLGGIAITLLTVSFQAIKAALANPVDSLRSE